MGSYFSVQIRRIQDLILHTLFSVADYPARIDQSLSREEVSEAFVPVATVKELFIYPFKSCRGIRIDSAECTPLGLKSGLWRDRSFMLVQSNGNFLTARQEPTLLKVIPSFHAEDEIWLEAPEKETLKINITHLHELQKQSPKTCRVWGQDTLGIDCGDQVSQWFSSFIQKDVRVVFYSDTLKPKFCHERERFRPLVKKTDATAFADFSGFMMMSQTSVDDLNIKLNRKVEMRRFRPNIVIEGNESYSEDTWKLVKVNDVWFRCIKPCQRCVMITTDTETGVRDDDGEALNVLRTYRKAIDPEMKKFTKDSPLLGVNLGIDQTGTIAVGDSVEVIYKPESEGKYV